MYNLKAIQIFVAVAELSSFRKAAEALNRSQSAVSTQIKLLEEQIGVALFHRTTRRVQLTAEGEQLLSHAQRAIAALEMGLRQIKDAANLQVGHIAMGCIPSLASTVLPDILAEFRCRRSSIRLELRELHATQMLEAISRQDIAFGIGPEVEHAGDFDFMPITDEPFHALLPKAYWLPGRDSITLTELVRLPVVVASSSAAFRATLNREMTKRGLTFTDASEVVQVQTMLAFARAGMAVAILPSIMIPVPLDENLQSLPVVEPELRRTLCLITLKGNALSPAANEMYQLILKRLRTGVGLDAAVP
jgi:DNA-binding transcriptional LysR family regulator